MKVRVLSHVGGEMAERIQQAVPEVEVIVVPTDRDLDDGVEGEVLFTIAWGTPNMESTLAHGVRWAHTMGTGVDRFPLHLVGDRVLTCSRGAGGVAISEWVLTMMLAFEKRIPDVWLTKKPERWHWAPLGGLSGRTLGLVGLGGIGSAVAQRALPFGMRVVAFRRTDSPSPLPDVELVRSLPELLDVADHVVITAPATPETHHMIDASALARMKPTAHLVNIARGALIDQDALHEALDRDQLAMASLDAVDPEPLPKGHWMYKHPKVRLSAHISWSSHLGAESLFEGFVDNLRRYLAGEPLHGVVDVQAGY